MPWTSRPPASLNSRRLWGAATFKIGDFRDLILHVSLFAEGGSQAPFIIVYCCSSRRIKTKDLRTHGQAGRGLSRALVEREDGRGWETDRRMGERESPFQSVLHT